MLCHSCKALKIRLLNFAEVFVFGQCVRYEDVLTAFRNIRVAAIHFVRNPVAVFFIVFFGVSDKFVLSLGAEI
jgi:hypothetical protein